MNITERAAEPVYTSDRPAIGTYEEALAHIGRTSRRYVAEVAVSDGSVKMFCAMVQDPNPAYCDEAEEPIASITNVMFRFGAETAR